MKSFDSLFPMPLRKLFALVLATSVLAVSCHSPAQPPQPNFAESFPKGHPKLTISGLGSGGGAGSPTDPFQSGWHIISLSLSSQSGTPITGGTIDVFYSKTEWRGTLSRYGPYLGKWSPFTGYAKTGDHSPKSPLPGVYYVRAPFGEPGVWNVVATSPQGEKHGVAVARVSAVGETDFASLDTKGVAVETPVATSEAGLRKICTRQPPDEMHGISLDAALKNGEPTVVVFSTPGSGHDGLDAVVTDEVLLASQTVGSKANFVHVDTEKDSAAFDAWKFPPGSGPWVIVTDKEGYIQNRFEGPTTAPMIELALQLLEKKK